MLGTFRKPMSIKYVAGTSS